MDSEKTVTEIINVNILDVRRKTSEPLNVINAINVGYIIATEETMGLLRGARQINVGEQIIASPEAVVLPDAFTFINEYLLGRVKPQDYLAFAPVLIDHRVTPQAIEQGIASLSIYDDNPLVCPQHLAGAIQARLKHVEKAFFYNGERVHLYPDSLVMDESLLQMLEDAAEVVVVGSLRLPWTLANDLLERKLKRLMVSERITCHEENLAALRSRLEGIEPRVKIIPAGYELFERPLELDAAALASLPVKKLFCKEWVAIKPDVTPEAYTQAVAGLISEERVYYPAALKNAVLQTCDWRKSPLTMYHGDLWLVDDDRELPAAAFDGLMGKVTLVVMGSLSLAADIVPANLSEKVDKVHNLGEISGTPEQLAALQPLLGLREGDLVDATQEIKPKVKKPEADGAEKTQFINANYIAL